MLREDNEILTVVYRQILLYMNTTRMVLMPFTRETIIYLHNNPIFGTGQGSSCSPPIWCLISDKLFKVHAVGGNGAHLVSPDSKVSARVGAVSFVDNTNNNKKSILRLYPTRP
jgi:hypothetical protein